MNYKTNQAFTAALHNARDKHPRYFKSRLHYLGVLWEEVLEHSLEILRGRKDSADVEGCHVVAVIIRGIEGREEK
jgi:hypothetical protein